MEADQKQARIIEARKLQDSGYFHRPVKSRAPENIEWDLVVLECGHSAPVLARATRTECFCADCADAWLRGVTNDQTRS